MQAHLRATRINVWRVVSDGMKNNGQEEKQYDVTAKCIILSFLSEIMFLLVKMLESYGRLSIRTMRAQRM